MGATAGFMRVQFSQADPGSHAAPKSTAPFRSEHVRIAVHLAHLERAAVEMLKQPGWQQRQTMRQWTTFLAEQVQPHAEWEEAVLYPVADQRAGSHDARFPFTAALRHEHRIIERWMRKLSDEAAKARPDVEEFVRLGDNLLGLLRAHFEVEEQVLLPVLDATMTPEEFRREVMEPKP